MTTAQQSKSLARSLALWVSASCLLGLGGCRALPTIHPDMALPAATKVQVEGSKGPLSTARSQGKSSLCL